MDFDLSEAQQAVADAAAGLLAGTVTAERLAEVEATADRFDRALWADLAGADLLGLTAPEAQGGSGLGIVELCLVAEQAGRVVARVPLAEALVTALALGRLGTAEDHGARLGELVAGRAVWALALEEPDALDARTPTTVAERTEGGWRLRGDKLGVAWVGVADGLVVSATVAGPSGPRSVLALVDAAAPGVALREGTSTTGAPRPWVVLDGVEVPHHDLLTGADPGPGDPVAWLVDHLTVAVCATQLGVATRAMEMAAAYTAERQQFGRPIATFQAIAMHAADCYIDVEAMRATLWQAADRLARGAEVGTAVEVAKSWAAEGGRRALGASLHLHGGVGVTLDYPLHRYYLAARELELYLGGSEHQLARIGAALAAPAAEEVP